MLITNLINTGKKGLKVAYWETDLRSSYQQITEFGIKGGNKLRK